MCEVSYEVRFHQKLLSECAFECLFYYLIHWNLSV